MFLCPLFIKTSRSLATASEYLMDISPRSKRLEALSLEVASWPGDMLYHMPVLNPKEYVSMDTKSGRQPKNEVTVQVFG